MPIVRRAEDLDTEYLLRQAGNNFFEDYVPKKIPSKMYESIKISTDELTIKLIDKHQRDLISIVHGNFKLHNRIKYFEVAGTYSKLERNGYLTYLFEILVYEFGYKILSDSQHSSPGSKEFWQAHLRRNKFSIYRLNLETNYKRNANRFKENEIWTQATSKIVNPFFDNLDYLIEDDTEVIEDVENYADLDDDYEEVIEVLDANDISDEELSVEMKKENSSPEDIRLVAQKYVG